MNTTADYKKHKYHILRKNLDLFFQLFLETFYTLLRKVWVLLHLSWTNTAFKRVKHGGSSVTSKPEQFVVIYKKCIIAILYCPTKRKFGCNSKWRGTEVFMGPWVLFWLPVCNIKLKLTWIIQQDNDPKHGSKSKSERLKKYKFLDWNAVVWFYGGCSCSKTLECGWIKTILQRRWGQNSSQGMSWIHLQLL